MRQDGVECGQDEERRRWLHLLSHISMDTLASSLMSTVTSHERASLFTALVSQMQAEIALDKHMLPITTLTSEKSPVSLGRAEHTHSHCSDCQHDDKPEPEPWDVSAGSVSWLLHELGIEMLYAQTFEDEGVTCLATLHALGIVHTQEKLRDMGVTPDHRDRITDLLFSERACGTLSKSSRSTSRNSKSSRSNCYAKHEDGVFNKRFLNLIRPLFTQRYGCENMAPLLYSMIRFIKPQSVLEVGAGYSTIWIAQALKDNDEEISRCAASLTKDKYLVMRTPYLTDDFEERFQCNGSGSTEGKGSRNDTTTTTQTSQRKRRKQSLLTTIDDLGASEGVNQGIAHQVIDIAKRLDLFDHVRVCEGDAYDLAGAGIIATSNNGSGHEDHTSDECYDLVWLDFGLGTSSRISAFLDSIWPQLQSGGFILMHSTLTNKVTRDWLDKLRIERTSHRTQTERHSHSTEKGIRHEDFDMISFLEPHKRYLIRQFLSDRLCPNNRSIGCLY